MGLTREELIEKLIDMDRLLLSNLQWTKGAGARDPAGQKVPPDSPDAVCWCLSGAAFKVARDPKTYTQIMMCLLAAISRPPRNLSQITIGEFNDASAFPEIKELIHKAREIAKSEEPWTATLPDRLK